MPARISRGRRVGGGEHVFAVVEHDEVGNRVEELTYRGDRVAPLSGLDAECGRDRSRDLAARAGRRQVHENRRSRGQATTAEFGGDLDRQPGLADPTRAQHGHEAVVLDQRDDRHALRLPSAKRVREARQ